MMSNKLKHLFEQFKPEHYLLRLSPDKNAMTFTGSVIITGKKAGRPSQRLTLHQKDLKITNASITTHGKNGDKTIEVDRINNQKSFDEVRLHATETLFPGSMTVRLEFSGKISRQMNGMYPSVFELEGEEQKLIATQFESHHAREVFPCVDEPAAKATFELTIVAPKDETVISNTPVKTQSTKDGLTTTTFEKTPHMSTYLLAFVYGNMGYAEAKTKRGTVTRIYATPDNVKRTAFALDFAVKCLEFYEDYFGIPYPLEKCDHIALPDFASGAMENWGCITYREQALLIDEQNSPLSMKQRVAVVIAHELAHQWFGNLVTMRWWTDLWLNEGFASWIEFLAVDHIFPEWNMWTQFLVDDQQQALRLDALEHTHPVEVPIHHPDEIRSIFDAISYSKGASVIHMLHNYLGADNFQAGLKYYLETHAYKNTDTVDLWQALEKISGKPVMDFMNAWTSTSGFPLVTVEVGDKQISASQQRFFTNPEQAPSDQLWPIDLLSTTDTDQNHTMLESENISIDATDNDHYFVNKGSAGFYRVAYNATHLQTLGHQIKKGHIDTADRLGILADLAETAKAGKASTADCLQFLENFSEETDYAVWDVIAGIVGSIRSTMNDDELRENMKPFIRTLVAPELKRLGWEKRANDSHFDQLLRPTILGMAASADQPDVIKHVHKLFNEASRVDDVKPDLREAASSKELKRGEIDPDMRGIVFGTMARLGDEETFNKLKALYDKAELSDEKVTIAAALTGFKQPKLVKRALDLIRTDDVRLQDVAYWIAYSLMNRYARELTWEWVKDNWSWLDENLGTDLSFYRMPIYAARVHSDISFKKDYVAFFEPKLNPAFERAYRQGLEILTWQSAWRDRDIEEVKKFFKDRL